MIIITTRKILTSMADQNDSGDIKQLVSIGFILIVNIHFEDFIENIFF